MQTCRPPPGDTRTQRQASPDFRCQASGIYDPTTPAVRATQIPVRAPKMLAPTEDSSNIA